MYRVTRAALLSGVAAITLHAAVIRGTVMEERTGYILARAEVTLEPIPNAGQEVRTVRTRENGQFVFANLASGSYLVKASRRGFMPLQYGQKRWDAAGTAITVGGDEVITVTLRMLRYGAIVGTVRDGNEVGNPDQDVAAYTTNQPPVFVARGKSDERGVFRIAGLEPGNYLVRTTGNNDEDRSYLPTFSRQTLRVEEARPAVVYPDEDAPDNDIRPIEGKLFSLSGYVPLPAPSNFAVTVTLVSDLGRTFSNGPSFRFSALAPGHYGIYAQATENPPGTRILGGYTDLLVERNTANYVLPMYEVRPTPVVLEGAGQGVSATALIRRKDYAGTGAVEAVMLKTVTNVWLSPGNWEVQVVPQPGYYVSGFGGPRNSGARPDGWNQVLVNAYSRAVNVTLSNGPSAIHGMVRESTMPAGGAPVFLEAWDPITRARLIELRETRTDMNGNYRFDSVAPGDYRVLSTFEYAAPKPEIFEAYGARAIRVEKATDQALDLDLSGNP